MELPEEALDICREYDRISGEMKKLETEKNATVNQLKRLMKEAEVGTVGERKISWKEISKSSLDSKKLKTEQPDIYNHYLSQSSYRRFSVA